MLKKSEYLKSVKRPYPPLFCSLVCMGYANTKLFAGTLKESFCIPNMAHVDSVWYYDKAALELGGRLALDAWRESNFFTSVQNEFKRREDALVSAAEKSFEKFCQAYQEYMPPLALIYVIDVPAATALRSVLAKKVAAQEVDRMMSALNTPVRDNFHKQEMVDLVMTTDLKAHVEKYRWVVARYGEEKEYTLEDARMKLREIEKKKFLKNYDEEKSTLHGEIAKAKKLLGTESYLVDIFQYIIYYRTHRTDIMNKSAFLAIPMLKVKAALLGLTYEELLRCDADEVLSNKIPARNILQSRMRDCSTISEGGKVRLLTGAASKKMITFFSEEVAVTQEIKGSIACTGCVQGIVKIISVRSDFQKIEEGNILVTSMTTPEMLPVMKKAAAFVTDEGGVTCHAAIISREMKKPCIIGSKIATKVLKDGDLVEVDAERGIVRKIS